MDFLDEVQRLKQSYDSNEFKNKNPGLEFYYIKKGLIKMGVHCNHDPIKWTETGEIIPGNRKIVFFKPKYPKDNPHNILKHCNGMVCDYITWKILCYPPPIHQVYNGQDLTQYKDTYIAHNGTIINLYHHNNEWRISTLRGQDVTDLSFRGNKYNKIFDHIDINTLDTNNSYTYGINFRHNSSLPIWKISETNLESLDVTYFDKKNDINRDEFLKTKDKSIAGLILRHDNLPPVFLETNIMKFMRQNIYNIQIPIEYKEFKYDHSKYVVLRMYLMDINVEEYFPELHTLFQKWDTEFNNIPNTEEIQTLSKYTSDNSIVKNMMFLPIWYNYVDLGDILPF